MWLGNELGDEFKSPSDMRSIKEEELEEGTTIKELLETLAKRYPPIANKVFDMKVKKLYPHILLNYNDRVISPYILYDQILKDGDKITIFPMYMGG
jgi:molybdopterin converting factor small subunit